jgi:hypothetical protein
MGRGGSENQAIEATVLRGSDTDRPRVLAILDPDYATEFVVSGVDVIEIDLGRSFNGIGNMVEELGEDEARDYAASWLEAIATSPIGGPIRQRVEQLIAASGIENVPQPQPRVTKRRIPKLLVIRDPDEGLEFVADEEVEVLDLDLGAQFNGPKNFFTLPEETQDAYIVEQCQRVADLDADDPIRLAVEEQMRMLLED